MKTVITTCDQCLLIINKVDVLTGIKYVPTYVKYELNTEGIKREFCSMLCLESTIHPIQKKISSSGSIPPNLDELISSGGPIG